MFYWRSWIGIYWSIEPNRNCISSEMRMFPFPASVRHNGYQILTVILNNRLLKNIDRLRKKL
jgi:hypothetical protein